MSPDWSPARVGWQAASIFCSFLFAAAVPFSDQSPGLTGRIEGLTVSAETGQAVPGVQVMAISVPATSSSFTHRLSGFTVPGAGATFGPVMTDEDGRFSFRQLSPGWYEFLAFESAQGVFYGAKAPMESGRMVRIDAEGKSANIRIQVWPLGTIAGHARTGSGEPISGLAVVARSADDSSAEAESGGTMTDDQGRFLIALRPGRYIVSTAREFFPAAAVLVADGSGRLKSYPPTFYPDSGTRDGAAAVTVHSRQRTAGIDFRLAPQPWLTVTGQLERSESNAKIRIFAGESPQAIELEPNGSTFTTRGLVPGQYRLQIIIRPSDVHGYQVALWADEPFSVNDRDVQLTPRLREGFTLSGTVEFDGSVPTSGELNKLSLNLDPLDNDMVLGWGTLDADRRFATIQLAPGRYYVHPELPGRFLKSVTSASGRDFTGAPISVVDRDINELIIRFSEQPARVQGTVSRTPGHDVPRVWVAVFPVERELWSTTEDHPIRFARILTGTDGTYDATLPPGRYYVIAIDRRVRWRDDWASLAARAELIDLREGTLTRNLTVTSMR